MDFRTPIKIDDPLIEGYNKIDYNSKIVLLGSCFSENIGLKFEYFKFQSLINPFGILFHPIAIANFVKRAIHQEFYTEDELIFHNERYHCFDAHSDLSSSDKTTLLDNLNRALKDGREAIANATHIILTFGTSWVYEYIQDTKIVANCHKVPQKEFCKKLLSTIEIEATLNKLQNDVKRINDKVQFIVTVSPVRHIKDGFSKNQLSKAHLLTGVHQFINENNSGTAYFPSYEIMMDDLRDYRFYNEDMIHPNQIAIDYIWEQFQQLWISSASLSTMKKVDGVQKGISHRPFNSDSSQHQQFLKQLDLKIQNLASEFPHMKF